MLADAMAAVLGLVVHRRRPLEVEEGDVRRAGQRDPLAGDARRADQQLRPAGLEALDGGLARGDRVAAEEVQRVREALDQAVLHRPVPGEDDERLVGGEEVLDPGERRVPLAGGGQPPERVELGEALGAQRGGDLLVELAQVERLLAQPGDHVLLGEPVVALVVERHRHRDLALGGQLGQDVGLRAADEAAAAQVPVDPLLGADALEAAGEARAGPEVLQPAEDAQLGDQLLGVVHHRGAGEREPERVGRERLGEPPHRLRPLRARVLHVVRLVEHQRLRPAQREPRAMRVDDVVVDDGDVGGGRDGPGAGDHGAGPVREPVRDLPLPVELQRGGADHDRRVGVVLLERGERLHGLAEALLVGQERAPRAHHIGDAGALERPQLAAEDGLDRERIGVMGARAADVVDGGVVLDPQRVEPLAGVRRHLDAVGAQVVVERLDEVRVERQRAAVRLARGQGEEGGDRVGIPVDVEREARLADAVDEREGGGRRRPVDLERHRAAQRALVQPRPAQLEQLLGGVAGERDPVAAPALLRGRRERLGQLAGDRLELERAAAVEPRGAHAADPAARRLGEPGAHPVGDEQRREALHDALDVRRGRVGLRRPPLLRVPVEAAARDRADRVDDVGPVREGEDDVRVSVPVVAELHVRSWIDEAHEPPTVLRR